MKDEKWRTLFSHQRSTFSHSFLLAFRLIFIDAAMDRAAREPDLGVGALVYFHQHIAFAGLDDRAENSADRLNAIAFLELAEHVLSLLLRLLL